MTTAPPRQRAGTCHDAMGKKINGECEWHMECATNPCSVTKTRYRGYWHARCYNGGFDRGGRRGWGWSVSRAIFLDFFVSEKVSAEEALGEHYCSHKGFSVETFSDTKKNVQKKYPWQRPPPPQPLLQPLANTPPSLATTIFSPNPQRYFFGSVGASDFLASALSCADLECCGQQDRAIKTSVVYTLGIGYYNLPGGQLRGDTR